MCACYKIVIIINYIVRGLFPYFSNLRECQSSYQAKGQFVICAKDTRGTDIDYIWCVLRKEHQKMIKLLNTDSFISLIFSTCCEEMNYWGRVWAGWCPKNPFMILWTCNKEMQFSDNFNNKQQRGAILHAQKSYVNLHWIQQDMKRVLSPTSVSDNGLCSIFWSFRGLIPTVD